jgi:hypothetical protein
MAPVYSKALFGIYSPPSTTSTPYTVPTGITTVVRSISITNQTGSAGGCRITDGGGIDIASVKNLPLLETSVIGLRAVLEFGDGIKVITDTDGYTVRASGYELTA